MKNIGGENRKEVTERVEVILDEILTKNIGKRKAIISHGAAIKFLLKKYCKLNKNNELEYNGKVITLNSPGVVKIKYKNDNLLDLSQII